MFYDSQLPGSQDHMQNSNGLMNSGALDERDDEIYGGKGLGGMDMTDDEMLSRPQSDSKESIC